MSGRMYRILILSYYRGEFPLRKSVKNYLYFLNNSSSHYCFHVNLAARHIPWHFRKIRFDLIVFNHTFFSLRDHRNKHKRLLKRVQHLKESAAVKVIMPQDEHRETDALCEFVNEFGVNYVFTPAAEHQWRVLYNNVDRERVSFFRILTGYLTSEDITAIENIRRTIDERRIHIGYRARPVVACMGKHAMLKVQLTDLFNKYASEYRLVSDISNSPDDVFLGDEWYKFLCECKYTIGVEGGASVMDRDGTLRKRTTDFTAGNRHASFDEIEAAIFPGLDGSIHYTAITPRHLEACATRTCQVLIEGEYNGILVADEHYIELKRDFSNIAQVMDRIVKDEDRDRITGKAYQDIVASGRYSYERLVEFILMCCFGKRGAMKSVGKGSFEIKACQLLCRICDESSWVVVAVLWNARRIARGLGFWHLVRARVQGQRQ